MSSAPAKRSAGDLRPLTVGIANMSSHTLAYMSKLSSAVRMASAGEMGKEERTLLRSRLGHDSVIYKS